MDANSKEGFVTIAVMASIMIVGLLTGSTLLRASTIWAYAKGGAIVDGGTSVTFAMINCSTDKSGLRETHGFYFSAHTNEGYLQGHWDFASAIDGGENKGGTITDGKSDGKT